MAEPQRPLFEEVLDYLIYAPLGVVTQLVEDFPSYVDEGRRRFETRLNAARIAGRFTVATLRRRVEDLAGTGSEVPVATDERALVEEPSASASVDLAIPGYDSLAASQVVARLAGLTRDERAAVRRYEEATRGRRTVLGRIAQLDADEPRA